MYSARYCAMITSSNSLHFQGDGVSNQGVGLNRSHWAIRTAPRVNRAP